MNDEIQIIHYQQNPISENFMIKSEELMPVDNAKIGIVGGGNMGEAFAGAMIQTRVFQPSSITISDIMPERLNQLEKKYHVHVTHDNFALFDSCGIIILAVKPQQMKDVLSGIAQHPDYSVKQRKLIISIAAGITIEKLENLLYTPLDEHDRKKLSIIRVMPNTPALVLKGMSAMSPNQNSLRQQIEMTRKILQAMGHVIQFEEKYLNAVTALSGSGPAYIFYLIECMIAAGVKLGLTPEDAEVLTLKTIKGAVDLMESQKESAEALRKKVTSPGGTTEAAFDVLEANGVKQTIINAIIAAADRAVKLSR
jgi:pyrroline-5-carboxylate reductase